MEISPRRQIAELRMPSPPAGMAERWGFRSARKGVLVATAIASALSANLKAEPAIDPVIGVQVVQAAPPSPERTEQMELSRGKGSYFELSKAFYGDRTQAIFAAKQAYQLAHPGEEWLADYSQASTRRDIPIILAPANDRQFSDGSDGSYDARSDSITLKVRADIPVSDMIHEEGHSTQHDRSFALGTREAALFQSRHLGDAIAAVHRLQYGTEVAAIDGNSPKDSFMRYITGRQELEIRLQSMNRYFFAKTGHAIQGPGDAQACLAMVQVEKDPAMTGRYREALELPAVFERAAKTDGAAFEKALIDEIVTLAPGHA